jgi:hypothetical protein
VCAGEREKRIGEKKKIFVVNFGSEFLWAKWSSSLCDFLVFFSDFFWWEGEEEGNEEEEEV